VPLDQIAISKASRASSARKVVVGLQVWANDSAVIGSDTIHVHMGRLKRNLTHDHAERVRDHLILQKGFIASLAPSGLKWPTSPMDPAPVVATVRDAAIDIERISSR
jgi:hypothetical protein